MELEVLKKYAEKVGGLKRFMNLPIIIVFLNRKSCFDFTGVSDISTLLPHYVIAIDNFEQGKIVSSPSPTKEKNNNQKGIFKYYQFYFLSHCHSDHFKGLDDKFFQNASTSDETCIVCHPITRNLLLALYPKLDKDRVLSIDLLQPTLLTVKETSGREPKHFMCTLLSSNHCPGSCMFLFEIAKPGTSEVENILYCGDFRDPPQETITHLKSKKISKIYIDDTFCDPSNFLNLPKRSNSIKEIINLIEKEKSKQRAVYIALDLLGTERVLFDLANHFKTKLYCDYDNLNPKRRKEIDCMKSLKEKIFTREKEKTFIRIVSKSTIKSLAELLKNETDCPLLICVSTMFLKYLNKDTLGMSSSFDRGSSTYFQDGIWKILYSFHSSHKEILKFLEQVFGSMKSDQYPSIISLNPHQTSSKNNKHLLDDIRKGLTSSIKVEDDPNDYGFFTNTENLFKEENIVIKDNFLETLIGKKNNTQRDEEDLFSSLETEPYTSIPEEDLDAEKLFEEFNSQQDELITPTNSHPITFSLVSPFTPQPPSSQKKRLNSSSNDESFNMLNLSEDDNTPKQSEKKKKKLE